MTRKFGVHGSPPSTLTRVLEALGRENWLKTKVPIYYWSRLKPASGGEFIRRKASVRTGLRCARYVQRLAATERVLCIDRHAHKPIEA